MKIIKGSLGEKEVLFEGKKIQVEIKGVFFTISENPFGEGFILNKCMESITIKPNVSNEVEIW